MLIFQNDTKPKSNFKHIKVISLYICTRVYGDLLGHTYFMQYNLKINGRKIKVKIKKDYTVWISSQTEVSSQMRTRKDDI